jgi:hypothetical protein
MTAPVPIICKPTPWFLFRAVIILLMFGVFAVLFFIDGSTGYRKKNLVFYIHQSFQSANEKFSKMDAGGSLTPESWKEYAAKQTVSFPEDRSILPSDLSLPMPWPEILQDYKKMKPLQWNKLWLEYSGEKGYPSSPSEEPYDARKIQEQWVVFWFCLALAIAAAFILVRTMSRKIIADDEAVTSQQGRRVPYGDLKILDLRKWETKGLAFINYEGSSGKGRIRVDGLTYGGFKPEEGEPAEQLMKLIRSKFSGEILEYAPLAEEDPSSSGEAGEPGPN